MNKYGVKKGSIVTLRSKHGSPLIVGKEYEVDSVYEGDTYISITIENYSFTNSTKDNSLILFDVINKGKIIGYELLKDTPEAKKGLQVSFVAASHGNRDSYQGDDGRVLYLVSTVEGNTEWFKPIYEPTKPTEVKVQTLAGEVKVNKYRADLNGEVIPLKAFEEVAYMVNTAKTVLSGTGFKASIETFKVGCKTFHVSDIAKIEEAIKQVS